MLKRCTKCTDVYIRLPVGDCYFHVLVKVGREDPNL